MHNLLHAITSAKRSMAVLIDPEKCATTHLPALILHIQSLQKTIFKELNVDNLMLFVGGSTMDGIAIDTFITHLKEYTDIPILIFPGSYQQLSEQAHGLLFLNLLSGRNPDYLATQQIQAAALLKKTTLEIVPTAYLLIDGGKETAVQRVSQTTPLSQTAIDTIVNTAYAGQLMGNRLIYLEAGSGALNEVNPAIVKAVCDTVNIPVIVGGGLKTIAQIERAFTAGACMVVVGTAIENGDFLTNDRLCD